MKYFQGWHAIHCIKQYAQCYHSFVISCDFISVDLTHLQVHARCAFFSHYCHWWNVWYIIIKDIPWKHTIRAYLRSICNRKYHEYDFYRHILVIIYARCKFLCHYKCIGLSTPWKNVCAASGRIFTGHNMCGMSKEMQSDSLHKLPASKTDGQVLLRERSFYG